MQFRASLTRSFLAICCLGLLLPTVGLALPRTLSDIACDAIYRGCMDNCTAHGGSESCYRQCASRRVDCDVPAPLSKQQTSPPPCRGIRCTLRNAQPPTTVGTPNRKPRPERPVHTGGISNPNTGNGAPVILLRKNDSGQGHRH